MLQCDGWEDGGGIGELSSLQEPAWEGCVCLTHIGITAKDAFGVNLLGNGKTPSGSNTIGCASYSKTEAVLSFAHLPYSLYTLKA